jgi:hypothetical protein
MRDLLFLTAFIFLAGCASQTGQNAAVSGQTAAAPAAETRIVDPSESYKGPKVSAGEEKYKDFVINNSVPGLSVNKQGRQLLFIKSDHGEDGGPAGFFALQPVLGTSEKQLVYNTWTGGAHCCSYFWIVDLSQDKPKVIFQGKDYDVQQNGENDDPLGLFDMDNDGINEITQSHRSYYFEECAEVSQPMIYTGFKFDKNSKQYRPMREFVPIQAEWVEELKNEVSAMNAKIRENEDPEEHSCEYRTSVVAVALSYIFIGKEKEGYDYLDRNYMSFDRQGTVIRYDRKETKDDIKWYKKDISKQLKNNGLYKKLYKR